MGVGRLNRNQKIRAEEKKYHDHCYTHYSLFKPGSWLHKPVRTVMELLTQFEHRDDLKVLDLGAGNGRNSIPIAQALKMGNSKVVCVDLLESAIAKLRLYSEEYSVTDIIEPRLSDIEHFAIEPCEYDMIIAVSALEHLSSADSLEDKLREMESGTKIGGVNGIIIGSNIRETMVETHDELDPMFEVNLPTADLLDLLDRCYGRWELQQRFVKSLEYEIVRDGRPVRLQTECITYVVKKVEAGNGGWAWALT